jgi:hypothetical protein
VSVLEADVRFTEAADEHGVRQVPSRYHVTRLLKPSSAQWEIQEQRKVSIRATMLYMEASHDRLHVLRTKGEVTEIDNRLMEISLFLGQVRRNGTFDN